MKLLKCFFALLVFLSISVCLKGQLNRKIFIGRDNGLNSIFYFDSCQVKIINYAPSPGIAEFGFFYISDYSVSSDTLNIQGFGTYSIRRKGSILKEIKSGLKGPKDRLEEFDSNNSSHLFWKQMFETHQFINGEV